MAKNKLRHSSQATSRSASNNSLAPKAPLTEGEGMQHCHPEGLRQEYTEVNNDIRHYSTLRFASFTVYFAALGGIIAVAFGFFEVKSGDPEQIKLWGRIGGLLVTLLFFCYELRLQAFINHSLRVGKSLEQDPSLYPHFKKAFLEMV